MSEENRIELRPRENGDFDELVIWRNGECLLHAEMMDHNRLWIGIYPPGWEKRVVMWIDTKSQKLRVNSHED